MTGYVCLSISTLILITLVSLKQKVKTTKKVSDALIWTQGYNFISCIPHDRII